MGHIHAYSKVTQEAIRLLGQQIRIGRKKRGWSVKQLAERAGASRATVQKIEYGALGCSVGLVFELAALTGVRLFDADLDSLQRHRARSDEILTLLPKHTHPPKQSVNDDF